MGLYPEGCSVCQIAGYPVGVAPIYSELPAIEASTGTRRFSRRLPYETHVTLGEGDTPLVSLESLGQELGLESLHMKLESANPTGSHKDRMSAQFISRAVDLGVQTVAAASSGNAGASLAAYAAVAGIRCVIVTTDSMNAIWRHAITSCGAEIHFVGHTMERWHTIKEKVAEEGWLSATNYLDPPVGSEPLGVEGYKTLAYELAVDPRSADTDAIFVPCARGDLLWGLYKGYRELADERRVGSVPPLIAVEPFPRLERVIAGDDYRGKFSNETDLVSIAGTTVTYQSLCALELSEGRAVAVNFVNVSADQRRLAAEGHFLELSAAAALTGLRNVLARGDQTIRRPILVATSHGYKAA